MALTNRFCPECGGEIVFSYTIPERSFRIENGKITSDNAWEKPIYGNPHIDFYCSNDKEHDIETPSIVYEKDFFEWAEEIEDEFTKTLI